MGIKNDYKMSRFETPLTNLSEMKWQAEGAPLGAVDCGMNVKLQKKARAKTRALNSRFV